MGIQSIVCLDVETTGLSYADNEIIEIGAIKLLDGEIAQEFSSLIRPKGKVDDFVADLTGIHQSMLTDAPTFAQIADQLIELIGDSVFVAHNVQFDFEMLNAALKRIHAPPINNTLLDTQELATIIYPNLYSHKLSALTRHFAWPIETHHRALSDAMCVAHLYRQLEKDARRLCPVVLAQANKLISANKIGLKLFFNHAYNDTFQNQRLYYKDYLTAYKSPTKQRKDIHFVNSISSFFSEEKSKLKSQFQTFEFRPSQQAMSQQVWDSFMNHTHSVIEAGTGTGKSLAYLIPSIIWATTQKTPVVICTKTKHLQNQLESQDIPKLEPILPGFSYCLVKGKENYIDIEKFDELYETYILGTNQRDVIEFLGLLSWILQTETGDLTELHPNIHSRFYHLVHFTTFSESVSKKKNKEKCFVNKMRKKAKDADIIVTNHALILADLVAGSQILPDYQYLIIDEAHHLEEAATNAFSSRFSNLAILDLVNFFNIKKNHAYFEAIDRILSGEANEIVIQQALQEIILQIHTLKHCNNVFFDQVHLIMTAAQNKKDADRHQLPITEEVLLNPKWMQLQESYQKLSKCLETISQSIEKAIFHLKETKSTDLTDFLFKLTTSMMQCGMINESLSFVMSENPKFVRWIEFEQTHNRIIYAISASPIDCSRLLSEQLFAKKQSIITTSATLTVQQSFAHYLDQIGLLSCGKTFQTVLLPSEFDYKVQAKFYVISDMPYFTDSKDCAEKMAHIIAKAVKLYNGRTLVLFTSYKILKNVYYALKSILKSSNFIIYSQHLHGSRESILERFKADPNKSVLLGVDSFWEGVDIPGNALSCVILQKLPFNVPTDPIHEARMKLIEQKGGNSFLDYMIPLAILKFKQGIGRLIRSKTDSGAVIVLDNRLTTKSYGKLFLNEIAHYNVIKTNLIDMERL